MPKAKAPKDSAEETPKPKAKKPAKAKAKADVAGGDGPALVIVESPAKERTISRFLKSGFVVKSSYGHVRDLPVKKIGVAVEDDFNPQYVLLPRAKKIISEFKPLAQKASSVFLATDHDREGESIAWHLVEVLNLPKEKVKRITFHEITPTAIKEALEVPRTVDENLVHAQQARRVIDRLVGYKLSPLLWAKIQSGLSAGRVQSVAVRLLSEREAEIGKFEADGYWSVAAKLDKKGSSFEAKVTYWKGEKLESTKVYDLFSEQYRVKVTSLRSEDDVNAVSAALKTAALKVTKVEKKEARRRPPPPFATSTMQQAASQKLYFAAERTMRVAQSLYEGVDLGDGEPVGLITYMRTDSLSIAKSASEEAAKFVGEHHGARYVPEKTPVYQTKSQGAQEAHEAIRPTSVFRTPSEMRKFLQPDQAKLYELIWTRFVASQMVDAVFDTVAVDVEGGEAVLHATGRQVKFDGFLKVYGGKKGGEEEEQDDAKEEEGGMNLPDLSEGDTVKLVEVSPEQHQTAPPPHYNEASLIRAMERHGIGRPSTYAPTIKTIVNRGYVRRGIKDRKLIPSDLGILVTQQLKKHFPDVVSLTYTAEVEERLDSIAEGKQGWTDVVREFYEPFSKALDGATKTMEVTKVEPKMSDEKCPICTQPMLIRESRFGKYLSCTAFPKCKGKIQLTPEGKKIVPEKTGEMCDICGKEMVIRTGRKGRFLACSGYPSCKNTFSLDEEGKKIEGSRPVPTTRACQKCGSVFWLRLGKRGFFLACSGFPKCRNIRPVSREEGEQLRKDAPIRTLPQPPAAPPAPPTSSSGT
jgi:DNA topoisomerase I